MLFWAGQGRLALRDTIRPQRSVQPLDQHPSPRRPIGPISEAPEGSGKTRKRPVRVMECGFGWTFAPTGAKVTRERPRRRHQALNHTQRTRVSCRSSCLRFHLQEHGRRSQRSLGLKSPVLRKCDTGRVNLLVSSQRQVLLAKTVSGLAQWCFRICFWSPGATALPSVGQVWDSLRRPGLT